MTDGADVTNLCAGVSDRQQIVKRSVLVRTDTAHNVCLGRHGDLRSAHTAVFMCFVWI